MPAAAKVKSEAGAIAFVKYYFSQVNLAWTTPDPDAIRGLSNPDCLSCASLARTASDLESQSQRYDRDPVSVERLAGQGVVAGGRQQVAFKLIQHRSNVVDSTGRVVLTDEAKEVDRRIELEWVGGQWRVWDIG